MRLTQIYTNNNQKGFSLVELLVTLSIMGIVLVAAYNFFFYAHKSYALADARSAAIQEVDLFFLQLEKDIRSASIPNSISRAINVSDNNQQIDIYSTKSISSGDDITKSYLLTSYRLNGREIQRGYTSSTLQSNDPNPQYGGIPDNGDGAWKTIVNNILPGEAEIFNDRNDADDTSTRRLIDVDLYVQPSQLNNSINMKTSLLSRTGRSTSSIIEDTEGTVYKKASYIKFFNNAGVEITDLSVGKSGATVNITASAFASDGSPATNRNILFKQNIFSIGWATFPEYSLLYDDGTGELFEVIDTTLDFYRDRLIVRSGHPIKINVEGYSTWIAWQGNPRTMKIEAVSPDGPTATLVIKQNH